MLKIKNFFTIRWFRIIFFITNLLPLLVYTITKNGLELDSNIVIWNVILASLLASLPVKHLSKGIFLSLISAPIVIFWIGVFCATGMPPSTALLLTTINASQYEIIQSIALSTRNFAFIILTLFYIFLLLFLIKSIRKHKNNTCETPFLFIISLLLFTYSNISVSMPMTPSLSTRAAVPFLYEIDLFKESIRLYINKLTLGRLDAGVYTRDGESVTKHYQARKALAIFVIGESLRADAFIDPHRGTYSRLLQKRIQHGLGMRMSDTCSYSNATFLSVPRLVTESAVNDTDRAEHASTFLADAKAAGFKTIYISNHPDLVIKETGHYLLRTANLNGPADDKEVTDNLKKYLLTNNNIPVAALLHIYGQHYPYADRYPHDETSELYQKNFDDKNIDEINYQRAAEYGNQVLLGLADLLDQSTEPAFLVFTSDHGENLPSDHTGKLYHAGPTVGKHDTTVPFLILWNQKFVETGWLQDIQPLIDRHPLIAHRDIANAWLTLSGWHDKLTVTSKPQTWGARKVGDPYNAVDCESLAP